ncbi:hypothetical protein ACFE04_014306 [Oxalis oulophora]
MGACATKPKTLSSDAKAEAPEPAKEEVAVEVTSKEIVLEGSDEIKKDADAEEVKVVEEEEEEDDDKKTSLSNLLKNEEGIESTETENPASEQVTEEKAETKLPVSENPKEEQETKIPESEIPVEQDPTPAAVDASEKPATEKPIEVTETAEKPVEVTEKTIEIVQPAAEAK